MCIERHYFFFTFGLWNLKSSFPNLMYWRPFLVFCLLSHWNWKWIFFYKIRYFPHLGEKKRRKKVDFPFPFELYPVQIENETLSRVLIQSPLKRHFRNILSIHTHIYTFISNVIYPAVTTTCNRDSVRRCDLFFVAVLCANLLH